LSQFKEKYNLSLTNIFRKMGLFDWLSPKKKEVSIQEMRNLTEKMGF